MNTDPNNSYFKYQLPDQKHRTQLLWQIWVPLIVILLLAGGLFTATLIITRSGSMDLGQIQNAAIILLILPLALIGMLTFIALGLAIAGTSRAMQFIPRLRLVSMQLDSIAGVITTWSNRLMLPFVIASRVKARLASDRKKAQTD
jgi:hypothetical protein